MYSEKPQLHARQAAHRPGQLRSLAVDITPVCNLRCSYCYAETFVSKRPVELDAMQTALTEACEMGVFHFILQGGEAILAPQRLEKIITFCQPEKSYINLVSNGWAMTPKRIAWLRELQVDKISYSLDSGIPEEHDAIRGKGSYVRVLQAIEDTLAAGLLTGISTVVTRTSLYSKGFQLIYDYAVKQDIRLHVQIAEPVGKWDGQTDLLMRPQDTAYIWELYQHAPTLKNGQNLIHRDLFCGEKSICPAGTEFMSLSTDGEFLPCNFLQFSLGNIQEHSLSEMRQKLLQSNWFDGQHSQCLCGEDSAFIEQFIVPYREAAKPLNADQVFDLKPLKR